METNATGELGVGARPALPTLRIAEWIRVLGPRVTEPERRRLLERVGDLLGLEAIWTFAFVEDDLFVRDCAGPLPVDEETGAVLDLLWRRLPGARTGSSGVRGETLRPPGLPDARPVVVVFRDDGRGLVLAARLGVRADLTGRDLELLGSLADGLLSIDLDDGLSARHRWQDALRARLDRAAARAIHEALALSGGDRLDAAVLLGVEVARLASEIERLGLI